MNRIATFRSRTGALFARAPRLAAIGAALLTLASTPRAAWASGVPAPVVIVLPASGRGVSAFIVARARALMVRSLGRSGRLPIIDDDRPPTAWPASEEEAGLRARQAGADAAVSFDVAHDGGPGAPTTLELVWYDLGTGGQPRRFREMTTAGPEVLPDLVDWIAQRLLRVLARSPVARAMPATAAAVAQAPVVAQAQAPAPPKPPGPRVLTFGARTSVVVPVASPARNVTGLGGLGLLASADGGWLLVDLGLDYVVGSDRHMTSFGLGVFAPLGTESLAPYVGGGVLWVEQRLGGRGASGLQLRPTVGLAWGRREVMRARLEAAYFVDLFQELEPDGVFAGAGAGHVSHGLSVALGATF